MITVIVTGAGVEVLNTEISIPLGEIGINEYGFRLVLLKKAWTKCPFEGAFRKSLNNCSVNWDNDRHSRYGNELQ